MDSAGFPPNGKPLLPEGKMGVKPLPGVEVARGVGVFDLLSVDDESLGPPKEKPPLGRVGMVVTGAGVDEEDVVETVLLSYFF